MHSKGVSIIIPTWNGKQLLARCLPPLLSAMPSFQGPWEIIVVDDAGTDDTGLFLGAKYPEVRYQKLPTNVGNGQALNHGAALARYELLFFLDNDVEVTPSFLDSLLPHFEDKDVFAVGCHAVERGNETGSPLFLPRVKMRYGIFWYYYETLPPDMQEPVPALFASAGHALFSRNKVDALGGFDELYGKYYLEDLDLCYRAWKKGWRSLVEARSKVYHEGAGTIGKVLTRRDIQRRQWRNRFLFTWKNIQDPSLLSRHLLFLIPELLLLPFLGKATFTQGFFDALPLLGSVPPKRRQAGDESILSDAEVLKRVGPFRPPTDHGSFIQKGLGR